MRVSVMKVGPVRMTVRETFVLVDVLVVTEGPLAGVGVGVMTVVVAMLVDMFGLVMEVRVCVSTPEESGHRYGKNQ